MFFGGIVGRWERTIAKRRYEVQRLYFAGKNYLEISELLGVSTAVIGADMKALEEAWLESALADRDMYLAEELCRISFIESEALGAWERSKQPKDQATKRTERTGSPPQEKEVSTAQKTGQTGNPRYLEIALQCADMRLRIFGAYDRDRSWRRMAEALEGQARTVEEVLREASTEDLLVVNRLAQKAELPLATLTKDALLGLLPSPSGPVEGPEGPQEGLGGDKGGIDPKSGSNGSRGAGGGSDADG